MRTPITWVEKVVGVFVLLVGAAVVVSLFMAAQKQNIFGLTKTHTIHTYLETGAGVKEGSPVKFKDVEVGAVTDMKLVELTPVPGKPVKVDLRIEGDYWRFLPKGTTVKVEKQLVGGTSIDLMTPSVTAFRMLPLEDDAVIPSEVPEPITAKLQSMTKDLDQIKAEVIVTLHDVQKTVQNIRIITDGLATGKGMAGRILQDEQMGAELTNIMGDVKTMVADVKGLVNSLATNPEGVPAIMKNVVDATTKVNTTMDRLPDMVASIQRSLADVEMIVANVREASGRFPEVARQADTAIAEANRTIEAVQEVPPLSWNMPDRPKLTTEYKALPRGGPR